MAVYPVTNIADAVDLIIEDGNTFGSILRGDTNTSVVVDGGTVPSVQKALADSLAYKMATLWQEGLVETDLMQLRDLGGIIFAPISVPVTMTSPISSADWRVFSIYRDFSTEPQTLTDGQLLVTFANPVTSGSLSITGPNSDNGKIYKDQDYSETSLNSITLFQSYPAGTVVNLTYTDTPDTSLVYSIPSFASIAALQASSLPAGVSASVQNVGPYVVATSGAGLTLANGNVAVPDAGNGSITSEQYGAAIDGVTDDRSVLISADAVGDLTLSPGVHYIATSMTFTNTVTFSEGARLSIAAGATVTFNKQPVAAPERQIFEGLGSVATLDTSYVSWFAGDKLRSATDALTDIQKAYDAARTSAIVEWPVGYFTIPGDTAIDVAKGQITKGAGPFKSELRYSSDACYCFDFNTTIYPEFHGLSVNATYSDHFPTSGTVLKTSATGFASSDFVIRRCYIGLEPTARGMASNFEILDAKHIGFYPHDVNDFFINNFLISAPTVFLTVDDSSGFTIGEVITGGTSGATGIIQAISNATTLQVKEVSILFVAETITGGTSLETAVVSSASRPHTLGGIRLLNKAEAIVCEQGDIIGGTYPMTTAAAVYSPAVRPAYNKFSNVYFDSGDNGVQLDKCVDMTFTNCWFSNRPNDGCNVETTEGVVFNSCDFVNSYKAGCRVTANAINTRFANCTISGNNQGGGVENGINIAANTNDFVIQGCRIGGTLGFGTQQRGVLINAGTSDRYIVADNLVSGNNVGGVLDQGTGVNKRVADNY